MCKEKEIGEGKTAPPKRVCRKIVVHTRNCRDRGSRYGQIGGKWHCWSCYVHGECNTDLETPDVVRAWTDIEKHRICKSPRERNTTAGRVRFVSLRRCILAEHREKSRGSLEKWRFINIESKDSSKEESGCDN